MSSNSRTSSVLLWVAQAILAALFIFAGVVKLTMPAAQLEQFTGLPGAFMRFISFAEISGALGLVLPGVFRVARGLTPLAAVGLVTIMAGAVTVTATHGQSAQAVMPFVVGIVLGLIAHGRRGWIRRSAQDLPAPDWVRTPIQTN